MPIVYSTPENMPTFVLSESQARSLVESGKYSSCPNGRCVIPKKDNTSDDVAIESALIDNDLPTLSINVNTANSKELTILDEIGVAKARTIVRSQPDIKSIDQLKEIVPDVNWDNPTVDGKPVTIEF